jgi:hypothetical protein
MNADRYPWNVHVTLGGVSFDGPGMESEMEAEAIKNIVEQDTDADVEVIRQ